ncbi:MAG: esterase-like activity of phytase family protein [Rhizobiaceae bacterium]|nr:esterase-like activity of phytase family protein [Rhizobiaceae bacterium]
MIGRLFAASLALASLAGPSHASEPFPVELQFSPIEKFRVAGAEGDYGRLTFIGGFSMTGDRREFGQLSGFRFVTPGGDFLGVADHGFWFTGTVQRDEDGVPVGLGDFSMQQMVDEAGRPIDDKERVDAEGISIHDGVATVSFERRARVSEYAIDANGMSGPIRDLDFLIPRAELRYNAGLETVARSPADGPLAGARIVIAEKSIDRQGNIFAAVLEGPRKGVFKVRRTDEFDVTDGVFLPDGDLLLLERRFSYARGVAMRLRVIAVNDIRPDALVDGEILLDANMAYHVDNMEALDLFRHPDGRLIVALMSDDNQSWIQRNLYLEFALADD